MRYQVPQFIEVEDKIFGPLTLKQFIYLAGGGGLCLVYFTFLPLYLMILLALPTIALSLALAFYEINGRPLIVAIEHAFGYYTGGKLYLWKQKTPSLQNTPAKNAPAPVQTSPLVAPKLSESRLKDLAWSLNIKQRDSSSI
ncbi:MAG TPA: PrgI family protein [Candidatus Paceibacterota bacterium]|nr:PrgI family protein [Candidatus Paceibacterota bacterium]